MNETTGQTRPSGNYQEAKLISGQGSVAPNTSAEGRCAKTAVVASTGPSASMHIVPRPPRQNGDEARTD
jgi:hypothetical protein